jgi:hypothetical protein
MATGDQEPETGTWKPRTKSQPLTVARLGIRTVVSPRPEGMPLTCFLPALGEVPPRHGGKGVGSKGPAGLTAERSEVARRPRCTAVKP